MPDSFEKTKPHRSLHLPAGMKKLKIFLRYAPYLGVILLPIALGVIYHELRHTDWPSVRAYAHSLSIERILLFLLAVAGGYAACTGYDVLGLHYAGRLKGQAMKAVKYSFIGFAFSHNLGNSAVTGTSVRLRRYSVLGLSPSEVFRVLGITLFGPWTGFCTLIGVTLALVPMGEQVSGILSADWLGWALLTVPVTVLLVSGLRRRPLRMGSMEFTLPRLSIIAPMTLVSILDWGLAGTAIYLLMPADAGFTWGLIIRIYLLSQVLGLLSQVPGGLGVFEGAFLFLLPADLPRAEAAGALVVFRVMYYFLPFAIAAALMAWEEYRAYHAQVQTWLDTMNSLNRAVAPTLISVLIFFSGALLLFSTATPILEHRVTWLSQFIPLGAIELSHLLASILGVLLIVLASALYRRVFTSYRLTLFVLPLAAILELLKGAEWEVALLMLIMAGVLRAARPAFTRRAAILARSFSFGWWASISCVVISVLWIGLFCYKHIDYTHDLWWQFAFDGDAPRFLRMQLVVIVTLICIGAMSLLRPAVARAKLVAPQALTMEEVREIVHDDTKSQAWLALLGDKEFFVSPKRTAFLMFGRQGNSCIVMGDPVGDESEWQELLWQFKERCDKEGTYPVFYEVAEQHLHYYVELGLTLLKFGESGRVPLPEFTLEGKKRARLRQARNRSEKANCRFEVLQDRDRIAEVLPALRQVSDEWLREKSVGEKGFTLGCFREEYLLESPIAVVFREEEPVAFANLWVSADNTEVSGDLMRYDVQRAPDVIMDYLFTELMLWAKENGYQWFVLGMTPLAGLAQRPTAPLWNRIGSMIFNHGERFYNFEGLREYKEKFRPEWEGRYIAAPGGWSLPRSLLDTATLIAGGSITNIFKG
ncbi:bifunctional lysylphosphatidylglycerol flippase/synthetase MprF [bacterium]|nr:bifunctional lysylphosphatidylglycerol flippase/synthetase MprF [bacterium]